MKKQTLTQYGRLYEDPVALYCGYIGIILLLANKRLSKLHVSILAYAALNESLAKSVKLVIAQANETSEQVVSNAITKLRKMKYLEGCKVAKVFLPPSTESVSLNITLDVKKRLGAQA